MSLDEALQRLRNPKRGYIDLTGLNVQQLKDPQARKALETVLEKVLPRRKKGIQHSSYYRELRVRLLPDNPYFRHDVAVVRQAFGIPDEQIREQPDVFREQLASAWLRMHRSLTLGLPLDPDLENLPQWVWASTKTTLADLKIAGLDWATKAPDIPRRHAPLFDLQLTMDRCAAHLIERYGLPWTSTFAINFHILTGGRRFLERIFPFDVAVEPVIRDIGESFVITVDWVDEYTTQKQWDEIFHGIIRPRQEDLWERRGETRRSKQVDPENLRIHLVSEIYQFIVKKALAGEKIGVDAALEALTRNEASSTDAFNIDRSVVIRFVKRLDRICRPRD